MTTFQVRPARSRAIDWTGAAASADRALEVAAQAAGYHTFGEMPDTLRTGSGRRRESEWQTWLLQEFADG